MKEQQKKSAIIAAAAIVFIVLAFVLGIKAVARPGATAPTLQSPAKANDTALPIDSVPVETPLADPAKAPTAGPQTLADQLTACQSNLQAASDSLNAATGNNKGGYDVKARADTTKALADISGAIDFAKTHPDIAQLPAPEARLDIAPLVKAGHDHPNAAPKLSRALDLLGAALDDLHKTPGGDISGFRDKVLADIELTASDTATGISIAAGVGRTPQPNGIPRGSGALPDQALEIVVNVNMGSTTTSHLQAAQAYLTRVVAFLDATPNDLSGGFDAKAKTDANQALDDIRAALAYIHDHPEIDPLKASRNPLPGPGAPHNVPDYARMAFSSPTKEISGTVGTGRAGMNITVAFGPMDANGIRMDQDGKGISVYLAGAMQNLANTFGLFTGPPGSPSSGMGDIGGFRAKIMDDISKTSEDSLSGLDFIHEHTTGTPVKPTFAGPGVRATAAVATSQPDPGLP